MSAAPLPELLDAHGIMAEMGVKYSAARAIIRHLDIIRVGQRVFVRRGDVHAYIEQQTVPVPKATRRSAA